MWKDGGGEACVGLSLFSCFLSLHVVTRLGVDYPMVEASGLVILGGHFREGHF